MGTWLAPRRVLAGYAVLMALLVAAHYALPGLRGEVAALIGVSAVVAMLVGVARYRPSRRAPWLLLAAANLAGALSVLTGRIQLAVTHAAALPFPSLADAGYLLFPAGAALGLWLFPSADDSETRRRWLLDGGIIVSALITVSSGILISSLLPSAASANEIDARVPITSVAAFSTCLRVSVIRYSGCSVSGRRKNPQVATIAANRANTTKI